MRSSFCSIVRGRWGEDLVRSDEKKLLTFLDTPDQPSLAREYVLSLVHRSENVLIYSRVRHRLAPHQGGQTGSSIVSQLPDLDAVPPYCLVASLVVTSQLSVLSRVRMFRFGNCGVCYTGFQTRFRSGSVLVPLCARSLIPGTTYSLKLHLT